MPRSASSVVRLDAARALAGSLRGSLDIELADPAELSQPAAVQEFGQRQQQLSDRAEHCLQGTLQDRALLREVEKLLRSVELDTDLEGADSQPDRRGSSSASSMSAAVRSRYSCTFSPWRKACGKRCCSQPCIFLWKSPPWSARTCAQEDSKLGRRGVGLGYGCG